MFHLQICRDTLNVSRTHAVRPYRITALKRLPFHHLPPQNTRPICGLHLGLRGLQIDNMDKAENYSRK